MDNCNESTSQDEVSCINEMVKAVLILDHSKKPFKESDVYRLLKKKYNNKIRRSAFVKMQEKLKEIGLILVQTNNTSSKAYFLVSELFPLPEMHQYANEREIAERTLLVLVLTFLMLKQEPVELGDILSHLKMLNIYSEKDVDHEYFGNVEKKISTDFISQMYLEKTNADDTDPVKYKWGERAEAEVSKKSLLEFVNQTGYNLVMDLEN